MTNFVARGKTVSGIPILDTKGAWVSSSHYCRLLRPTRDSNTLSRQSKGNLPPRRRLFCTCWCYPIRVSQHRALIGYSDFVCVQYLARIKKLREAHLSTAVGTVLAAPAKVGLSLSLSLSVSLWLSPNCACAGRSSRTHVTILDYLYSFTKSRLFIHYFYASPRLISHYLFTIQYWYTNFLLIFD